MTGELARLMAAPVERQHLRSLDHVQRESELSAHKQAGIGLGVHAGMLQALSFKNMQRSIELMAPDASVAVGLVADTGVITVAAEIQNLGWRLSSI